MTQADVIIVGGGLVGMTLALALHAYGLEPVVVDAADLEGTIDPGHDGRASAIASASARMLRTIGLGDLLDQHGCPIDDIRVTDGLSPLSLHFDSRVTDKGPLGWMVENRLLRIALIAAARKAGFAVHAPARITRIERDAASARASLADGRSLSAPLLVAADGRRSFVRQSAGIRQSEWSYPQTALVTMIRHVEPHGRIAYELFYPTGPFAILPMLDLDGMHRSAIVWTVGQEQAPGYLKLGPRAFALELARRCGGFLGAIELIAPVSSYPLGLQHAERYSAERLILVGDAAHGIHPIAGQGLNMGLRDVAALAQVLIESARLGLDLGAPEVAARYERWRRSDNGTVALVTDALNRLFALKGDGFAAVRRIGLAAVERLPPLKDFFMAEARGETGDLPALLAGQKV